jgi:hypothetical protein
MESNNFKCKASDVYGSNCAFNSAATGAMALPFLAKA